jgi:arsenate reductase
MKKIYYLPNCGTCKKIIEALPDKAEYQLQDIKTEPITAHQLEELRQLAGSYEVLFSRRSRKYPPLKDQTLTEEDYRRLILEEYTFLKRPVIVKDGLIFIAKSPV